MAQVEHAMWKAKDDRENQAELTRILSDEWQYAFTIHDAYESAYIDLTLEQLEELYNAIGEELKK